MCGGLEETETAELRGAVLDVPLHARQVGVQHEVRWTGHACACIQVTALVWSCEGA